MTGLPATSVVATSAPAAGGEWWRRAVIYQVYLRSFADGNGDGVGDLAGLRSRLPYLQGLGVDALWLTPWYPSPMKDGGYDVSDYRDIDPLFGSLDEADALLTDAHARGLKVIVDIVANHSSDQHRWFQAALATAPGSAERARYHFRDGRGPGGDEPPNDWVSAFGGPAWTRVTEPDGTAGQWYLHLFAPEQPDLNWDSPEVRREFEEVLRFWFDRGLDGLRVDAASAFAKHPELPDFGLGPGDPFAPAHWVDSPLWDVDGVHEIMRGWRAVADRYDGDRMYVGEVVVNGPQRLARYLRPDELHTAFNLDYLKSAWDAKALHAAIDGTLSALQPVGAPATWVMSNHDETRHLTRYGRADTSVGLPGVQPVQTSDLRLGARRARAALLLMLALPGSVYLYQGEELGLEEVEDLPVEVLQDPVWRRSNGTVRGRDGCRVPIPWSGSRPPFGFSTGTPWLPQPAGWSALTVEAQTGRPDSMLELYRTGLRLRHENPALGDGTLRWLRMPSGSLGFERDPGFACLVNVQASPVPLPVGAQVAVASGPLTADDRVPQDTAVWLSVGTR